MVSLYLDQDRITILKLIKQESGHFALAKYDAVDVPDGVFEDGRLADPERVAKAINELVHEEEVVFVLPESIYFTGRVYLPPNSSEQLVEETAIKQLGLEDEESLLQVRILDQSGQSWAFEVVAIPKSLAVGFQKLFSKMESKPSRILTEAEAAFPLLSGAFTKQEMIGYLPESRSLVLFDQWGPLTTVAMEGKKDLNAELLAALGDFFREYKRKVKKVVLAATLEAQVKEELEAVVGAHLAERKLTEIAPKGLEGLDLKELNLAVLGAFLVDKEVIDLAEKFGLAKPSLSGERATLAQVLEEKAPAEKTQRKIILPEFPSLPRGFLIPLLVSFAAGALMTVVGIRMFSPAGALISPQATPSPEPTTMPTQTPAPVDKSTVKIQVLNGTEVPRQAARISEALVEKEYAEPDTGNAETQDFADSLIRVKKGSAGAGDLIKKDLQGTLSFEKTEELSDDSEYDVVIIVGSDDVEE